MSQHTRNPPFSKPGVGEWRALLFLVTVSLALSSILTAFASEYSPLGLYDVEHYTLQNGLRVILKPRAGPRVVSIRLAVGVGNQDFPCGRREIPHILEHLLFSGTASHDESELDGLINGHGGHWNATTSATETIFEIDIFNKHSDLGLEILHEIISSPLIAADEVENVREIVHREMGGKPSELTRWLYRRGVWKDGATKAIEALFPGGELVCPGLETADGIARNDIMKVYEERYVADNMTLVVVGAFDMPAVKAQIDETFGRLKPGKLSASAVTIPPVPRGRALITGTLSPVLGSEAEVGIVFRAPGYDSPDYFALRVVEEYLDIRLFESLRVEAALAYAPEVSYNASVDRGAFDVSTDVEIDRIEDVLRMMEEELRLLSAAPLDQDVLDATKQGILMSSVWSLETNAEFADYYVASRHEIERHGMLVDEQEAIEKVTADDVLRVAREYLAENRGVEYRSVPTLTYVELYAGAAVVVLALFAVAAALYRHGTRRGGRAGAVSAGAR